jgi:hypothetical protein
MHLAEIIERYQARLQEQYATRLSPGMVNAMAAVCACRTEHYGQMLLHCPSCDTQQSSFHACGHRSCPRCQNYDTSQWLDRQALKLLPVDYFMVTFTLPYQLRSLTWQNQKQLYSMLIHCAVSTLADFGMNSPKLGADIGMTTVLHTHSRPLDYHPHVHIIIPGGCLNKRRKQWKKLRGKYLFNQSALAKVFRARFLQALADTALALPRNMPHRWVVHCKHVGKGLPALQYLARYLYRGVIRERDIIDDDGTHVTFRYLNSQTQTWRTRRVPGEVFLWLVFQHVLPKGFRRVRDFGFLHGNAKATLRLIQTVLRVVHGIAVSLRPSFKCLSCGRPMLIMAFIPPAHRSG